MVGGLVLSLWTGWFSEVLEGFFRGGKMWLVDWSSVYGLVHFEKFWKVFLEEEKMCLVEWVKLRSNGRTTFFFG